VFPQAASVDTCKSSVRSRNRNSSPHDVGYGPAWAATAVLARARALLMTRWPVAVVLRDAFVERVLEAHDEGLSLGAALARVQRDYLLTVGASGEAGALHPQLWAAWLAYGLD
jgi:hypothetical protein